MFRLLTKLPNDILVCCSGGVDSIAAAHFLKRKHKVTVFHFNHLTKMANAMQASVEKFCADFGLPIIVKTATKANMTKEAEFREQRIKFLVEGNYNAVMGHHISDAVESAFLQFSTTGSIRKIPINIISKLGGSTIYRPFLTTDKDKFRAYAIRNGLNQYIVEDTSNYDITVGRRNWIRGVIVPLFEHQQIGLKKIIRKKYLQEVQLTKIN